MTACSMGEATPLSGGGQQVLYDDDLAAELLPGGGENVDSGETPAFNRRAFLTLTCLAMLQNYLLGTVIFAFFPQYVLSIGGTDTTTGILFAMYNLGGIFPSILISCLMQRFSNITLVVGGFITSAAGLAVLGTIPLLFLGTSPADSGTLQLCLFGVLRFVTGFGASCVENCLCVSSLLGLVVSSLFALS